MYLQHILNLVQYNKPRKDTVAISQMLSQVRCTYSIFVGFYFHIFETLTAVYAAQVFNFTVRFIYKISEEIPDKTFRIRFRFYKIVHETCTLL